VFDLSKLPLLPSVQAKQQLRIFICTQTIWR
jgi:hypothetical protein